MPSSTSLGGLPQCRCHMLSLLFPGPESHSNIGNCNMMIWYGLPGQCNSTSSRVGEWICPKILLIAVLHIYCNFAFKNAICLQGDLAASVMATKNRIQRNHGCIRSMRTAADLHPLFRCVLFQIQRTLSLATPFPNWLCYANQIDFSICRMTRRVTWASDRWVYALHLLAKGHAEPCFYVHHLAMIERPW